MILICLLIVIALLLPDKIIIRKNPGKTLQQEMNSMELPDIMGKPKTVKSQSEPKASYKSRKTETESDYTNLDIEYDENENVDIRMLQEEPEETFSDVPDFEEEEEEWRQYGTSGADIGFAQGVTFDELNNVGAVLRTNKSVPAQKETAIETVQRLQGTELFALLEDSIKGASGKIAILLDSALSSENQTGSSFLQKNDLDEFDIGEFV